MSTALASVFAEGVDASKPTATSALEGYFYFSSDLNGGTLYQCKSSAWVQMTTGVSAAKVTGLTGAVAAARFAGGTTSGAPASGTFAVGDFVVDHAGAIWVCTVAGTPGTWAAGSGGGVSSLTGTANEIIASASTGAVTLSTPQAIGTGSQPTFLTITAGGLTGAVAASRYVGGTASGAPASGTFLTGDFVIDQTGKVWVCTAGGTPGTWVQAGGGGGSTNYVLIQDQEAQSTTGGGATAGSWRTRVLNTKVADTGSIASLASNQVTLPTGTYRVRASAPAFQVGLHQIRLQNITGSATLVVGMSGYSDPAESLADHAILVGRFTLTGSTVIELQHQVGTTKATNGFGVGSSFTTEIYSTLEFWQE